MQIKEIVLYSRQGQKRVISFAPGKTNIITGDSATGKSSLSLIVDYCLGRTNYILPEGVIKKSVAWFGLLLQFPNDQMFVARENPLTGKTTNSMYIEQGDTVLSLDEAPPTPNTTAEAIVELLSRKIGIAPNLHTPSAEQTRSSVAATIRHALFCCFQEQGEIATKGLLFHRQSEAFIPQAIKDTLPYFLGAIREDQLALEQELNLARRDLKRAERAVREMQDIQGEGESKARMLLAEATEVGLISVEEIPQKLDTIVALFQKVVLWQLQDNVFVGPSNLIPLQEEVKGLQFELNEIVATLYDATMFAQEIEGFDSEMRQQELRLASIGLFDTQTQNAKICPICSQSMTNSLPAAHAIQASVERLEVNLRATRREKPRLREAITDLARRRDAVRQQLREKNDAIRGILQEEDTAQLLDDINARRLWVIGRISLWLESVDTTENSSLLHENLQRTQLKVSELEHKLDFDEKEEKMTSILNRIGTYISQWSQQLELEYSENPVRFNLKKLTIMVDTESGAVSLDRIGSAQNWLGYHLTTMLALHRYFCMYLRPVPHFLFLDQPSQVYYPADQDISFDDSLDRMDDRDRQALLRAFNLIFDFVENLSPSFQVIITEHADLKDSTRFQEAIVEKWRGGEALIPEEWNS